MSEPAADNQPQIEYDRFENMKCPSCGALVDLAGIEPFSGIQCPACGAAVDVPAKFDHFRLLKKLGSGGMGTTFLAEDEGLDRKVAIKVMQNFMADDPNAFETFKNEAQNAASLNHPHVAQIYSFGKVRDVPYLAMELVPGGDLGKFMAEEAPLDPAFVVRVGMEIAEGLKAAEQKGLFHGDVKPDNILFDASMNAKLVDFGIASRASQSGSDELWGTPYYIAPEKVQNKKNSARSDIYSLGATLYHAIAGKPPFDGADAVEVIKARFKGPAEPLDRARPGVEPEVVRIVARMMDDPFRRYPNYDSLIGDMKKYLAGVSAVRKQGPKPAASRAAATGPVSDAGAPASGGGRKKFVISKGSMESAEARKQLEAAEAAAGGGATGKGGRIVLKKHGGSVLGPLPDAEGAEAGAGGAPEEGRTGGGNGLKIVLIAIGVVLALVVGGVVTGVVMYQNRIKREAAHMADLRATAAKFEKSYADCAAAIEKPLAAIRRRDAEAAKTVEDLNNLCEQATGMRFPVPDLEPDLPPEIELADAEALAGAVGEALVGAMSNALESAAAQLADGLAAALGGAPGAAAAAAPAAEAPAPKPKKKSALTEAIRAYAEAQHMDLAIAKDMFVQEAKQNGKTPEEYARELIGDDDEGDDGDEAAGGGEGGAVSFGVVADAAPAAPAHPFLGRVEQSLWEPVRDIREALRRCERIAAKEGIAFEPIPAVATEEMLQQAIEVRKTAAEGRKELVAQAGELSAKSQTALKELRNRRKQLEREAERYKAERERKAREDAEAKARADAEEKAAREEADRQGVAAGEIARIHEVSDKFMPRVKAFEYDGFLSALGKMENELSQPESREELRWTMERVQRVKALRAWILADLRANGTLRGGFRKFDVQGVTSNGRELLMPPPKPNVPVAKLETRDWLQLVRLLLERRPAERKTVNTMERGEQFLNAAIFCYLHGGDNYNAMELCKVYVREALKLRKAYRNDVRRLIPVLEESDLETPEAESY